MLGAGPSADTSAPAGMRLPYLPTGMASNGGRAPGEGGPSKFPPTGRFFLVEMLGFLLQTFAPERGFTFSVVAAWYDRERRLPPW